MLNYSAGNSCVSHGRVLPGSQHRETSTGPALLCPSFPFRHSPTPSVVVLHSRVHPLHQLNHEKLLATKDLGASLHDAAETQERRACS